MSLKDEIKLQGVIPATLLAFDTDFEIDEKSSRKHIKECALTEGISAITVNGHSSEVHACSFEEQKRILNFSVEEAIGITHVINGVYADGSIEAARIAKMSAQNGASALLCFPPQSMSMGGHLRPEMALEHFKRIADVTDLPLICFNYPSAGNLTYPFETLLKLFETVPTIKAIKDWSNDPMLHEKHIKTFQNLKNPVNVLTTHSSWLMSSLVMGANGLLSGAGSIIANLQVSLFKAVKNKDLSAAQEINDKIFPLAQAFYTPPFLDMHNRMKEVLVLMGKMESAIVRPPLMKLNVTELNNLKEALKQSGI